MTTLHRRLLPALALCLLASPARGEVTVDERGFVVTHELELAAAPAAVYDHLVDDVARWWHPSHTWSADAANLSIDASAGGCFCERWDGNEVEHLRVVQAHPGRMLRLVGALGPLQSEALDGSMTIELAGGEEGTALKLRYAVAGVWPGGFEQIGPAVDGVLGQQLTRLARYVATGSPEAP